MKKVNLRIKDIAILAGVSEGTVDRVLHNRGNVSAKSREKVEKALSEIDYKPNIYASVLAQKKRLHFICIIPLNKTGDYWDLLISGIRKASEEVAMLNVSIGYIYFDQYDLISCRSAFEKAINAKPDGVLFPPFFREESITFIEKLNEAEIPFLFLDSLIPNSNALSYFGQDSFRSGMVAAKLLMTLLPDNATIAMFITDRSGYTGTNQTTERKKGFIDFENQFFPKCKTVTVELNALNHKVNIEIIKQFFAENPETSGAVIFNSLSYMVTDYLRQLNKQDIKLIGYDLLERNIESLKNNEINFLIGQRPEQQGYLGVKALCDNLLFNKKVQKINYMPIDIIIKENIDYI